MNAYELADELNEYNKDGLPVLVVDKAEKMLRQQADELIDAGKMISMLREKLAQQTNPLSKEEIEGAFYKKCWYYDEDEKFDYYGFAREIEERHGIK